MSRIQKRRQQQQQAAGNGGSGGGKETLTIPSEERDEESGIGRRERAGGRGGVDNTVLGTNIDDDERGDGRKPGRRERIQANLDEKPKSDDEDDKDTGNDKMKGKLKLNIAADNKTNVNANTNTNTNANEEDKPLSKSTGVGRPPRGGGEKTSNPIHDDGGAESNNKDSTADAKQLEKDLERGPLKILQPLRTDPLGAMKNRHKKLERLNAESIPEIHFIGKILSGDQIVTDKSEGGTCRWRVESTPCWIHLGGELQGQSQVVYARKDSADSSLILPFDHPIDLHFAESGISGWGTPRLCVQTYRLDIHGRRILGGYGFTHLPTTHGLHTIEISLWRPVGSTSEEMESYLLGRIPALLSSDPIYETAWQDRERLMTTTAGTVTIQLYVLTRFMYKQNIDPS